MEQSKIYLPGLNGLRAIAAMGVLVSHIMASPGLFNQDMSGHNINGVSEPLTSLGAFSVTIFFALSGFLITCLLLKEKKQEQISIKKFYLRRILRIWPLYFFYLLITLITIIISGVEWNWSGLLYAAVFLVNFSPLTHASFPYAMHFWTLGVEEQFYLLWPWVIKRTHKNLLKVISIIIVVLLIIKIYARFVVGAQSVFFLMTYNNRFQCLLIGAFAAVLFVKENALFTRVTTFRSIQVTAWLIILLVLINHYHIISLFDHEIVSVATVIIIMGQITVKNRIINLERNIFNFTGTISYGIYVIHPLVLFYLEKVLNNITMNITLKYFAVYFFGIAVTILMAYLSYRFFEKRFLKMKDSFTVIKTL